MTSCAICGAKTKTHDSEFCSKACFLVSRRMNITCEYCGKTKQVLKCYSHRRFCSRSCHMKKYHAEHSKLVDVICAWCGEISTKYADARRSERNIFCNRACYNEFHSVLRVDVPCKHCGKIMNMNSNCPRQYCSRECYKLAFDPKNFSKANYKKGWFSSKKSGKIWYDSSLELKRFKELDHDVSVMKFRRADIKIPWIDSVGKKHYYRPDLMIEYTDGTKIVEECKGFVTDDAKLKIAAAEEFFNGTDSIYRVFYVDDLQPDIERCVEYYETSLGVRNRTRWEYIFMKMAIEFATHSTCNRLAVGALFADEKNERVLGFGYNGSYSGGPNECDTLEPGKCGCIHAELNAMSKLTGSLEGSTLYVTTAPCFACAKSLITARISRVIYLKAYRDVTGIKLLRENNIEVTRYKDLVDYEC